MKQKPPCNGCSQRGVGCHASCERYSEWKQNLVEAKRKREEATAGSEDARDFLQQGAMKTIRRNRKR